MKQIKILLIMAILTGLCSCRKNLLDIPPTNLLSVSQAFSSTASVTAYFASMYRDLPMEDYGFVGGIFWTFPANGNTYTANWADEANSHNNSSLVAGIYDDTYQAIRNTNQFIQLLPSQTQWDAATQAAWLAEARFIRAYEYFALVKFYGGVPIVLVPQATPVPLPRNKESEVYDQIKADLDYAALNLPQNGQINATAKLANGYAYGYGHADKNAALALEARVMIHAACIGKYGDPAVFTQTNGIVGLTPAQGTAYMQAAFDAAGKVITSGVYSLYKKYYAGYSALSTTDPTAGAANQTAAQKNFQYLFYDVKQGDANTEAIFCRGYDYATTKRTHSNDLMVLPDFIKSAVGYGSSLEPSENFESAFENLSDGSTGFPWDSQPLLTQFHYPTMTSPFLNKDPRLGGTVVLNGTQFRNSPPNVTNTTTGQTVGGISGQRGVIVGGTIYNSSARNQYFDPTTHAFSTTVVNAIIGSGNSDNGNNPGWLKKWTDPVTDIVLLRDYTSYTSWMDLRYGEVLLDYAEASFELGHAASESLGVVNQIRDRAGLPALTSISLAQIRHEEYVEYGFENKNYWNMVRWRTLTTVFNNANIYGLYVYWDIDTKDYVYQRNSTTTGINYVARQYYFDIPGKDLSSDPLLTHNPGY
jgi:hypothetical protein